MTAIQRGNREAFSLLVSRHLDALYNYALRLSRDRPAAEDLVQDTWLAVWQKARSYNPRKARVTTWLHRILHNRHVDTVRRTRPELLADGDEADIEALAAAADDADDQQTHSHEQLDKLINTLPFEQKSALTLSYLQGFSNREVGAIMGIGTRAVESLLARARRNLIKAREASIQTAAEVLP